MKRKQFGFSLIELVIAIVILSILAAIAIPKYVDLQANSLSTAKSEMSNAVKSAFKTIIANQKGFPTVQQLARNIPDANVTSAAKGVVVTIKNSTYTVPTYTNTNCTSITTTITNTVQCVGTIP